MGIASDLAPELQASTDADTIAMRETVNGLEDATQAEMRAAAADTRIASSAAGAGALERMQTSFRNLANRMSGAGRTTIGAETRTAADKAATGQARNLQKSADQVKSEGDALAAKSSADKLTQAESEAAAQGWSMTDYLVGIAGITIVSLGLASFIATNGARLNIHDIVIINSTQVQVDYDLASPGSGGLRSNFALRVGDYVEFDQPTPTVPSLSGSQQIVAVQGDNIFYIRPSPMLQTAGGVGLTPASIVGSPAYGAPMGSSFWHQATVHTTMSSQLTGQLVDGIAVVGAAAGAAAGAAGAAAANAADQTLAAITPALTNLAGTAGNAAGDLLHALTPAATSAFCDIVPIFCNSTLWWIVLAICICIIIIGIVLKLKK
jgi:hypothetical protein